MSGTSTSAQPPPFSSLSALLAAALRARSADAIRPFDDHLVRTLQRETRALGEKLTDASNYFRNEEALHGTGAVEMEDGVMCALRMCRFPITHTYK